MTTRAVRGRPVVLTDDGPILLPGPVDVVLPDGTTVHSERAVVAVCTCRRTRRPPWCDTSHRRKIRLGES